MGFEVLTPSLKQTGGNQGSAVKHVLATGVEWFKQEVSDTKKGVAAGVEWLKKEVPVAAGQLADTASNVVDFIPEAIVKSGIVAGGVIAPALPINAEKFFEHMSKGGSISLSEKDLSPDDFSFLKEKASEVLSKGESQFNYGTWGYNSGKDVLIKDLTVMSTESLSNPNFRMATLIGQTAKGNVFVRDGDVIVRDTYDFNSGPRGRQLQKAIMLREGGDEDGYSREKGEALKGLTGFEKIRVWGAALGNIGEKGTEWEMNLGPYTPNNEGNK